jgi:uridine kinase
MKVALLISGYLRSFNTNLPNLKSQILDKFDNVDVYIHITKNGDKEDKYLNVNNDIDYISQVLNPVCLLCEDNQRLSDDDKVNNTLNLWFKYYKLNEIKKENEEIKGKYDLVIKYRPDVNIASDNFLNQDYSKDFIYLPSDSKIDKSKLINIKDKYICDIFAFGNSKIMDYYFYIYENIQYLIKQYKTHVSETLLFNYLNEYEIAYKELDINYTVLLSMCNVFAVAGDSGSGKTTLGNLLKNYFSSSFMLECDRYHKWERKDDNWNKFTHLNPEANYLAKMNEDIFDLKIGKDVYQVDYNHSSGTFTQAQKLETSDNIIVCGLHSLYAKDDDIFNVKIFIDTDQTLKYTWKIKRDIEKRGYTKEKILKQIESRKEDYIKYILPQRDNSDIIINFFTDKKFDINNLDQELNLKLKILFNKSKYKPEDFIDIFLEFRKQNIKFKTSIENSYVEYYRSNTKFNEIIFSKFEENNLGFNNNNFYDYILYLILNLNKH